MIASAGEPDNPEASTTERRGRAGAGVGLARLAVGLTAGLSLYALHRAGDLKVWPFTDPSLFAALTLASAFAPLVLLAGAGRLRPITLAVWFVAAAGVCALFAGYHAAVALPDGDAGRPDFTSGLAAAAFLFVAHHLIEPADVGRTWIAPYPAYFDRAWLDGVQLALAIAFTGAFWLILGIGAALFDLIGLKGFETFIRQAGFAFPATTVMFAVGVHLGDVRVGLTRGLRTVGLILLSWLMPLMGLIALAFVLALPFTGLALLWKAGTATGILLGAAAALIVLINAAYQDGAQKPPVVQKWAARITALVLVPLAGIAAYGLALRIGEHGLTPQRIRAGACAVVGACYALGYAYAAVRPGRWMRRLPATNIAVAPLILVLLFALSTPLADPTRLSVDDQVARLQTGRTPVGQFDFKFLRFDAGQYGLAALHGLAERARGPNAGAIRSAAEAALSQTSRYAEQPVTGALRITVYPRNAMLPGDLAARLTDDDRDMCRLDPCEAYLVDLDGDGVQDVLLSAASRPVSVYARLDSHAPWLWRGSLNGAIACAQTVSALRAGKAQPAPPEWRGRDLIAGAKRLIFMPAGPDFGCPATPKALASKPSPAPPPSAAR